MNHVLRLTLCVFLYTHAIITAMDSELVNFNDELIVADVHSFLNSIPFCKVDSVTVYQPTHDQAKKIVCNIAKFQDAERFIAEQYFTCYLSPYIDANLPHITMPITAIDAEQALMNLQIYYEKTKDEIRHHCMPSYWLTIRDNLPLDIKSNPYNFFKRFFILIQKNHLFKKNVLTQIAGSPSLTDKFFDSLENDKIDSKENAINFLNENAIPQMKINIAVLSIFTALKKAYGYNNTNLLSKKRYFIGSFFKKLDEHPNILGINRCYQTMTMPNRKELSTSFITSDRPLKSPGHILKKRLLKKHVS